MGADTIPEPTTFEVWGSFKSFCNALVTHIYTPAKNALDDYVCTPAKKLLFDVEYRAYLKAAWKFLKANELEFLVISLFLLALLVIFLIYRGATRPSKKKSKKGSSLLEQLLLLRGMDGGTGGETSYIEEDDAVLFFQRTNPVEGKKPANKGAFQAPPPTKKGPARRSSENLRDFLAKASGTLRKYTDRQDICEERQYLAYVTQRV
jgi:hypothetical protein